MTSTYFSDDSDDLEGQDQLIGEDPDGRTPVCSGHYVVRVCKSHSILVARQDYRQDRHGQLPVDTVVAVRFRLVLHNSCLLSWS